MFEKIKLLTLPNIYTANAFEVNGKLNIGVGPEKEGVASLIEFPSCTTTDIGNGPGGMMSLIPVPGWENTFISVMGLFPPFKGKEAGIYIHRYTENKWLVTKAIDIPFAHRCEIIRIDGVNYLFSATVSRYKEDPADWSQPGQVFLTVPDNPNPEKWSTRLLSDSIFRNHGMIKAIIDSKQVICVSGAEGIFAFTPDENNKIKTIQVFNKEVSEFTFLDMDSDGNNELITIEPFHGNSLNIYKNTHKGWEKIYNAPLSFGHGLSSGLLAGIPSVAVGNRSEDASLLLFRPTDSSGSIERICIEEATGTTQTQFIHYQGTDYLLSANQLKSEAALYYLK